MERGNRGFVIPELQLETRAVEPALGRLRSARNTVRRPLPLPAEVWGKIAAHLDTKDTIALHVALNNKPSNWDVPNFANAVHDPFLQRALHNIIPVAEERAGRPHAVPGGLAATFAHADTARGVWSRLGIAKHVMKLAGEQRGYAMLALLTHPRLCRSARLQLAAEPRAFDVGSCTVATRQALMQSLVHGPPLDSRVMESALPRIDGNGIPLRWLPEHLDESEKAALGDSEVAHFTFLESALALQLKQRPRPSELTDIGSWALAQHFHQQAANSAGETAALQNIVMLIADRNAVSAAALERYAVEIGAGLSGAIHLSFYHDLSERFLAHPQLTVRAVRLMANALCDNLKTVTNPLQHPKSLRLADLIRCDPRVDQDTTQALALEIIRSTNGSLLHAAHFPFVHAAANDFLRAPNSTSQQKIAATRAIITGPFLRFVAGTGDRPFLLLLRAYLKMRMPDETANAHPTQFLAPLRSWNNFCLSYSSGLLTTAEKLGDLRNSFSRTDLSANDRWSLVWSAYNQSRVHPDNAVAHSIALHIIRETNNTRNSWAADAPLFANMWCTADLVPPSWRSALFSQTYTYFRRVSAITRADTLLLKSVVRYMHLVQRIQPAERTHVEQMAVALHALTVDQGVLPETRRAVRHELRCSGFSGMASSSFITVS